jgi:hypothetical protein
MPPSSGFEPETDVLRAAHSPSGAIAGSTDSAFSVRFYLMVDHDA